MAIRKLTAAEVIDQALMPAKRITQGMGPVGHHELSAVVTCFRTALLSLASYDPANPPTVEVPDSEPVEPEGAGEVVRSERTPAENIFA